jgi:hypothetical protein
MSQLFHLSPIHCLSFELIELFDDASLVFDEAL